jgi:hypothetical protein
MIGFGALHDPMGCVTSSRVVNGAGLTSCRLVETETNPLGSGEAFPVVAVAVHQGFVRI